MMKGLIIVLFLFANLHLAQAQPLFRIVQNNCIGYIDNKGKIVIPPTFWAGNDFSEGLAAVRRDGLYGFIDEKGNFVIEPAYDYTTRFVNGLALVYKDGKPQIINKTGIIALPTVYKSLNFIGNTKGVVTTIANRQGIIDVASGELLVDTAFSSIGQFNYGLAVVKEYTTKDREPKAGVIDTAGHFLVPLGKYLTISPFREGYARVEIADKRNKDGNIDGVIDTKGRLLFKRPYKNHSYVGGDFYGGYATVSLYKYWIPEEKGTVSTTTKMYTGFINLKGQVVFNDTTYIYANNFSNGRAFIKQDHSDYILIDKNFKRVGTQAYREVLNDTFSNGYAIVGSTWGYGIIDTLGNFVVKPQFEDIDQVGIIDDYFFISDNTLYGIADLKGNVLVKPIMQQFDRSGFINGLIRALIDDKLTYLNKNGEIVWQEKTDTTQNLSFLNIDFMNRGYFYAYSTLKNSEEYHSGGWATSDNMPKKYAPVNFPNNALAITIAPNMADTFANQFHGMKLFVSNTTADTVLFNAQDSRLYMKLQALDHKGEWRDIEYLPSSWCGNSYHEIALEPNAHWGFTIPQYKGGFPTKIRAELKYIDKNNPKKDKVVYSNVIEASINPGQFWNKREYHRSGIMDPYND